MLKELLDRPIAFHRSLIKPSGSVNAALMLSQALYWSRRTANQDGWFYKTRDEWEEETGLSREEQESARKKLRGTGFWFEERRGVPAKLYYRIIFENLETSLRESTPTRWRESRQLDGGKAPNKMAGKPPSLLLTETTTETTTEIRETKTASPFIPPTHTAVFQFMTLRGIANAEKQAELFIAHHANRRWRLSGGRGPVMKDWKMAVITWQEGIAKFGGSVEGGSNGKPGLIQQLDEFNDRIRKERAERIRKEREQQIARQHPPANATDSIRTQN